MLKYHFVGLFPRYFRYALIIDFLQTLLLVHLRTWFDCFGFGVKRSKVKVMPSWRRHSVLNACCGWRWVLTSSLNCHSALWKKNCGEFHFRNSTVLATFVMAFPSFVADVVGSVYRMECWSVDLRTCSSGWTRPRGRWSRFTSVLRQTINARRNWLCH